MPTHHIIAIDGPAASGKSSVARALAQRLGFSYVNSGAMYRAATWHIGQRDEIAARDRADSSRVASPLVIAPDAAVIDTSALTIDGVVDQILQRLVAKGLPVGSPAAAARRQRMNPYYWLGYTISRLLAQ